MNISNIISLLGGIALFLFGMSLMGDGLKKVAGNKLEIILYKLSNTTLKGVLLGTGVTAVIQSSSATSVMVVGFVNSGMMKKRQALSIIHGALIGTSITGWIICLSSIEGTGWTSLLSTSSIAAVIAVAGIILRMFVKGHTQRHVGDIMLGFSVLMFGMQSMSGAVAPLKESAEFISMLTTFSNPIVGVLVGAMFTAVLQSASAAVGILQALSMTGAITFSVAYPIILGIAVGASVPVLFSAIGAKLEGRRTAYSYLIIETMGAVICAVLFYAGNAVTGGLEINSIVMTTVSIALLNTVFRIFTAIILTPFNPQVERLVDRLIKEGKQDKSDNPDLDRLDERFLTHPALAIEQSRISVGNMALTAWNNVLDSISLLTDFSDSGFEAVQKNEDVVDIYEDRLGTYLVKLNARELDKKQNEDVSKYLHILSDIERLSDHAVNISESAKEIKEKNVTFTAGANHELEVLTAAVKDILTKSMTAFMDDDVAKARTVEPLEERVDVLCDEMKLRHIDRLQKGECSLQTGFVFTDLLTNFERIADHCSNVAIAIIELNADEFDTHEYVIDLKKTHSNEFNAYYEDYAKQYDI